jgi:hypothetical protein
MPGASDTYTLRMNRNLPASHARALIRIDTNDLTQAPFDIPVTGAVRASSPRAAISPSALPAMHPAPAAAPAPLFNAGDAIASALRGSSRL